jgi:hypothetical protein
VVACDDLVTDNLSLLEFESFAIVGFEDELIGEPNASGF